MASRRSLNGSMTVVGDIAQATGPLAPSDWVDVLAHLPDRKPSRVIGLSVGYRIPSQIMELANRVMAEATPGLRAPTHPLRDATPHVRATRSSPAWSPRWRSPTPAAGIAVVVSTSCDDISGGPNAGYAHGR
jgi:hypothetical protein